MSRSSRQRYKSFVENYRRGTLDDAPAQGLAPEKAPQSKPEKKDPGKRRQYLREYLRWLWPHRFAALALFLFALLGAGLQMVEPLFMRFIIDKVLLARNLDDAERILRLNGAGALFLALIIFSNLTTAFRDYRQR